MERLNLRDRWVLVTGASSGLGREMAIQLARDHHAHLVISARRTDRLMTLKNELETQHGVKVAVIAADQSKLDDVDRLFTEATQGRALHGAVLNAAVTHFGPHDELSWPSFETMLSTNVTSLVRMTTLLLPHLREQRGGVLLVSSLGGLNPMPYQTVYSATKAFVINYGCGLWHETRGTGVSVSTFAPGGIATEMTASARFDKLSAWNMPVDKCAREALGAFVQRKYLHVPGLMYRWGSFFTQLLPRQFFHSRLAATYRKSLQAAAAELSPRS